jgi:hypothetical protein
MTPKQKAEELYNKYFLLHESTIDKNGAWQIVALNKVLAKKCSLIAVDEMQLVMTSLWDALGINENKRSSYLEEVKKEIEKL